MRRVAVIADVHADLDALEVALKAAQSEEVDEVWCLGDVVGRGPQPIECLEQVFAACTVVLIGNHEAYQLDPAKYADDLTDWGRRQFEPTRWLLEREPRWPEFKERLSQLAPAAQFGRLLLVHASPAEPLWHEIGSQAEVYMLGRALPDGLIVVYGHTHTPAYGCFDTVSGRVAFESGAALYERGGVDVGRSGVVFLNPGTVGMSRGAGKPVEWGVLHLDGDEPARFEWRRTPRAE